MKPQDFKKNDPRINRNGRPKKGESLTELMREFLENVPEEKKQSYKELFIMRVYKKAMDGDIAAMKLIWNYIDGMPKETVDSTGNIILSWQKQEK